MDDSLVTPESPRRHNMKLWLWVSSLLIGSFIGVLAVVTASWFWAKSYLESPRIWHDLSRSNSFDVSATSMKVGLFPIEAKVSGLKISVVIPGQGTTPAQTLLASSKAARLRISALGLLLLNLNVGIDVADVEMDLEEGRVDSAGDGARSALVATSSGKLNPFASAESTPPRIPFRNVDFEVRATRVRLPAGSLPVTDVELGGSLSANAGAMAIKLRRFAALGLAMSGTAGIDPRGATHFALEFPEKESLISGKIAGLLAAGTHSLTARGELKLPNTDILVPADRKSSELIIDGKKLALTGSAKLGGGVNFDLADTKWSAAASWDLNATALGARYGAYQKAPGMSAVLRGGFSGTSEKWNLNDVAIELGKAKAQIRVEASSVSGTHIVGAVAPFEIAEFLPLLLHGMEQAKATDASDGNPLLPKGLEKVHGRASAHVDLTLPPKMTLPQTPAPTPSGAVEVMFDRWIIDGGLFQALAASKGIALQSSGKLEVDGKLAAQLNDGQFKSALVRMNANATALELRYGADFSKARGVPLIASVSGEGSGKSVVIRNAEIQGPTGVQIAAKGKISDFRELRGDLRITQSKIPLKALSAFVPKWRTSNGWVRFSGEFQGALKNITNDFYGNLDWELKSVAFDFDGFRLKSANARLQTIFGGAAAVPRTAGSHVSTAAIGGSPPMILVRIPTLSAQCSMDSVPDFSMTLQGNTNYVGHVLTGELAANFSIVDLNAWVRKKMAEKQEAVGVEARPQLAGVGMPAADVAKTFDVANVPVDFKRSKFTLSLNAPLIRTPYVDLSGSRATLRVGAPGAYEAELERIVSRAFGGDLVVKGKLRLPRGGQPFAFDLTATGQDLSMGSMTDALARISGKPTPVSFFGKGDVNLTGTVGATLAAADVKGRAEIRNGGFKFLPLPRSFLEKLNLEKGAGEASDSFEKALATFHLKGPRMDLGVNAADGYATMTANGFVTLDGHCELKGRATPRADIGGTVAFLKKGVSFTSEGDNWSCLPKLDLKDVARGAGNVVIQKVRDEASKTIQNSLKNIFGQ